MKNKLFLFLPITILTGIQLSFDFFEKQSFMFVFPVLTIIYISLYYILNTKKLNSRTAFFLYLVFTLLLISYLPIIFEEDKSGYYLPFDGWIFAIVFQLYIIIFRLEGTLLFNKNNYINYAMVVLAIVTFLIIGFMMDSIPNNLFLFTICYSFEIFFLVLMLINRKVSIISYFTAIFGVVFSVIGSLIFSYYVFFKDYFEYSFLIVATHNFGHYFMVLSIVQKNNEKDTSSFKLLWKFLRYI